MDKKHTYTLTASCPDRSGIIAAVSGFIASHNGWITEASHHADDVSGWYFMRQEILADSLPFDVQTLREKFTLIADNFRMTWRITDSEVKKRVAILVSKQDHCLSDLLYRWRNHELEMLIPCVISNHDDLRSYVEWHQIPFHHVPVESDPQAAFNETERLVRAYNADAIVLARYMRILPPDLVTRYAGRMINIHHSFLPSFVGAKPYHRAYERGVKLIGATCHYVTPELDAGPIIEQDVIRVDHGDTVEDMIKLGSDVEKAVLARGLHYHLEERVLIHQNKTVVFK